MHSVASYMGAWIETIAINIQKVTLLVASYMGAWIETYRLCASGSSISVASYMGAWIETMTQLTLINQLQRRILHGCVD